MGRARIVSGGTDGLYQVELDTGFTQIALRIGKVQAQLGDVNARIAKAEAELAEKQSTLDDARDEADAAIDAYADALKNPASTPAARETARKLVVEKTQAAEKAAGPVRILNQKIGLWRIERGSLQAEKRRLEDVETLPTLSAWCADLTENTPVGATVATLEVPGERGSVLVAPTARAPEAADGRLLTRPAMSGPQAYLNAALLPGWQRWRPTARFGTAVEIDYALDTMTVELFPVSSSAQALPINASEVLENVPVRYMSCNAAAFSLGDEVVVEFASQDWRYPWVVGFRSNPKPCDLWKARWTDGNRYEWTHTSAARWDELMTVPLLFPFYRGDDGTWFGMTEADSTPPLVRKFFGAVEVGPGGVKTYYPPFLEFYAYDGSSGAYLTRVMNFNPSGAATLVGKNVCRLYIHDGANKMHAHIGFAIDAQWSGKTRGAVTGGIAKVGTSIPILKLDEPLGTFP